MSKALSPGDPSSYSRPDLAKVTNIFLNWTINFEKKIISGRVNLTVEKVQPRVNEVILDAKDLKIEKIIETKTGKDLQYDITPPFDEFGSKLTVKLPSQSITEMSIFYETSPKASGLQWLKPELTSGKTEPYLFSQFQAIHARSVLPCQDTPGVKAPYKATIIVTKQLTALMSAVPITNKVIGSRKHCHFEQKVPIPSYLIAIAVGALESRKIGPRSHVWAEKEIIEACAYEFATTESQLQAAEKVCGIYLWGIYDLLVLPPSFPFGGMENPCLTFVTPTLLAGDRSLANVVAHEIAHSWTGNLVTNRNFEHFWLNEGFTVFVERKIKGRLASSEEQDFDAYCRLMELKEAIHLLGKDSPLTALVINLKNGVHPDDAFSIVPYEKGQTFLRYLENLVGGPSVFEPFLKDYLDHFKFQSIDTTDFKQYFEEYYKRNAAIKAIDWNKWLNSPGMPPVIPEYNRSLAVQCDKIVHQLKSTDPINVTELEVGKLVIDQRIYILQKLLEGEPLPADRLKEIDQLFQFSPVNNSEIKFRWFRLAIKAHSSDIVEPVLNWLNDVGRMKFVRPLYRDLYQWTEARQRAIDNFKANKSKMMHVTAYTVAKDIKLLH